MFKNRNGYWMDPRFLALSDADGAEGVGVDTGAAGAAEGADAGAAGTAGGTDNGTESGADTAAKGGDDSAATIAQLKAELAKQKKAIDDATKEAAKYKRDLRAKQTAEEIAAEEKKALDEQTKQEIEELRREVAKTKAVKAVMSKLGTDEEVSGKVAEYLYGAEDIDAALTEIQRAWTAKEKALKLEYGRLPAPGAGGANGEDAETQKALEMAKRLGQSRAANNKSIKDGLTGYIR